MGFRSFIIFRSYIQLNSNNIMKNTKSKNLPAKIQQKNVISKFFGKNRVFTNFLYLFFQNNSTYPLIIFQIFPFCLNKNTSSYYDKRV